MHQNDEMTNLPADLVAVALDISQRTAAESFFMTPCCNIPMQSIELLGVAVYTSSSKRGCGKIVHGPLGSSI